MEKSYSPMSRAWKKLLKNKLSMAGMMVIIIALLVALLGYWITPDSTPQANDMILEIGSMPPGFSMTMLKVKKNREIESQNFFTTMIFGKENPFILIPVNHYMFKEDKIIVNEFTGRDAPGKEEKINLVDVVYTKSITRPEIKTEGEKISFYNFYEQLVTTDISSLKNIVLENNIEKKIYLLGTDKFGRDILSRIMIGTRVSLSVGFISVLISLLIGIFLGAIAGYYQGKTDAIVMWLINVIWSVPTLLLVFAITLALGKGFWQIFVAVGLTMWVEVARIIRGQVMGIRKIEYIEAARAMGLNNLKIISGHILPNVLGPVIVIAAANFAAAILIEAGLSFLGIGVQPPAPSWGMMIKEHYNYIISNQPFLALIPGLAIMLMVLAFNLFGNGFRDAMDVKMK